MFGRSQVQKKKKSIGQEGELVVSVSARPVEGAANKAISKFASKRLGISASSFSLDSGDKSKHKRFKVTYVFTDHKDVDYYLAKLKQLIK